MDFLTRPANALTMMEELNHEYHVAKRNHLDHDDACLAACNVLRGELEKVLGFWMDHKTDELAAAAIAHPAAARTAITAKRAAGGWKYVATCAPTPGREPIPVTCRTIFPTKEAALAAGRKLYRVEV